MLIQGIDQMWCHILSIRSLNAQPNICKTNIIQLNQSHVKVLGELKDEHFPLFKLQSASNDWYYSCWYSRSIWGDFKHRLVSQVEWILCNQLVSSLVTIQRSTKQNQGIAQALYETYNNWPKRYEWIDNVL